MSAELALPSVAGFGDAPASVEVFKKLLGIITDTNVSGDQVITTAWRPIIEQWAQGWSNALVEALLESHIDLQEFLGQLLRRIWVTMLGESPKVIGTYVSPFIILRSTSPIPNRFASDLHDLLNCAHPGIQSLDRYKNPWGDHFHPPEIDTWGPTSAHVPIMQSGSSSIGDEATSMKDPHTVIVYILTAAKDNKEDINAVLMRAMPNFPDGITGIGLSAEARAFLACYLISVYSPTPNTMKLIASTRSTDLMATIDALPSEDFSFLFSQLAPVVAGLSPSNDHNTPTATWHSTPSLPLWYFAIELAERHPQPRHLAPVKVLRSYLESLHEAQGRFPVLTGGNNSSVQVSLATAVAWIAESVLIINSKPSGQARALTSGAQSILSNNSSKTVGREASWIRSTTTSDVDSCIDSLREFGLGELWQRISPDFRKATTVGILTAKPSSYEAHVNTVCEELLEAYLSDTILEVTKSEIIRLWVRFVALGDMYAEVFTNMAVGLDKAQSKLVFSALIKFFTPVPTESELEQIQILQDEYDNRTRTPEENSLVYLILHFIHIMTPIARYHTVLAETLNECGILTLLSAIRDQRYIYPNTNNQTSDVIRIAVSQKICDEMQNAISERLYIASQAKLLHENPGEMYTHEPTQTRRPIRRRPSWMATGG